MSRVERSALVRASAARMFALVNDVPGYPRRFAWCEGAAVLDESPECVIARLDLRIAGLRMSVTTRNDLVPDRSIALGLVDGPFRHFAGIWQFAELGEEACKVSLRLEFDIAGRLVGSALASGFKGVADRMVDDFVREARRDATQ
jgi:ribosome-associated toxin RatA of RatAB toxin-antitoxin module